MLSSPSRNIVRWRGINSKLACTLRLRSVCAVMSMSIALPDGSSASSVQAGEGLRAGVFVQQVQVAEQKHVLFVERRDGVRVDQLAVEGSGCHRAPSCRKGRAFASSGSGASSGM